MSHNVMSYVTSHRVMTCHVTLQHRDVFWVRLNNIATLDANVAMLLEIYEQRRDIRHERHDVIRFSGNRKVVKIQSLGLLLTSKLFFLHINHP